MVRRPDEVFLADLSGEMRDANEFPTDYAFLAGRADELPSFSLPVATVHPARKTGPTTIEMGWVDYDHAGDRLCGFAHAVRSFNWGEDSRVPEWMTSLEEWNKGKPDDPVEGRAQDLWDLLLAVYRAERFGANDVAPNLVTLTRIANEIRRRLLVSKKADATQDELLRSPVLIAHRAKKDPREIKILDPACGSGHFLLYCFDLLLTIYEEAYNDPDLGPALQN